VILKPSISARGIFIVIIGIIATFQKITLATSSASWTGRPANYDGYCSEKYCLFPFTHFQQFGQFFRTRLTFVFLFESHIGLVCFIISADLFWEGEPGDPVRPKPAG
jgi:hypothetical protein